MVTDLVRQRAAHVGAAGQAWLAGLPALVHELERAWSITVGAPLPGGSTSLVASARTADGRAAVLKVEMPDPDLHGAGQARTLRAARGRGYAVLLAHDPSRRALLLEALGTALDRSGLPPEEQLEILGTMLRRAWEVPRPPEATLDLAREKAVQLAALVGRLWEDLDRPCPARVVERALEYADRRARATTLEAAVVVHGDPHPGNALQVLEPRPGAEVGYVFVDPDGFVADPAYDAGVVLRDWCPQLLGGDTRATADRYCHLVAGACGLDATAVWEWGFLERVSTGLYLLQFGARDLARPFLDTAGRLA